MSGQSQKKPRFKENESFLHLRAKEELASWIKNKPELLGASMHHNYVGLDFKVKIEEKQVCKGLIIFTPDITVYHPEHGIIAYIEVVHTSPISLKKLYDMDMWIRQHEWWNIKVFEISAQWVMIQTGIPNILRIATQYDF